MRMALCSLARPAAAPTALLLPLLLSSLLGLGGYGCCAADAASLVEIEAAPGMRGGLHAAQLRARSAVAAGQQARVTLKAGTHHLVAPLRFGGEDRGTWWRADPAAPLGTVAVSGGAPLPKGCFAPTGETVAGGKVYKCTLPANFPAQFFEQLFVNGRRCPRARYPNFDPLDPTVDGAGYADVTAGIPHPGVDRWPSLGDAGISFKAEGFSPREWHNPANNATLHMFPWGHSSWGILIFDGVVRSNGTLTWQRGGWHINTHEFPYGDKARGGGRFFVEAVREELDAAYEWFLDVDARTVELVAPAGLDLTTADVVAPVVAQPFEHVGAEDVHIEGLNVTHTAAQYMLPYDNPSRGDWTIYRGGAVYFEDSKNCSVTNCFFDQVGSNGVSQRARQLGVGIYRGCWGRASGPQQGIRAPTLGGGSLCP